MTPRAPSSPRSTDFTIRAVLWDMDGTLMDSQPLWDAAFIRCCTELGGTASPEIVAELTGASIRRARELIAATGVAGSWEDALAERVFEAMARQVREAVTAEPPLLPGAREITSALAEVGLAQAIVSASPRPIVERVAQELGDVFVTLVTGDDGVGAKPDPLPYATAVERLGLTPEECVVVEDSPTGAASARSNGLHVVQIGQRKHFPADPGLVVVPDLASITPHMLLWEER
ncbi:haloacid dehalogenase [Actinomyces capricornis]|uniref:Haloacid dehalogenase n=2 Tax=Actinomyces capricornis TaxID=2755559 RepID=A0ABN6K6U5_9ACTO|nr:haloacid dehalogenase [Actinomyces capricornis]